MPLLRFIDSTWGDLQVITPAPLGTVHEPCIEVVMPVPTVVLTTWRLTVIDNPAALAINLLGVFRFRMLARHKRKQFTCRPLSPCPSCRRISSC